MLTEGPCLSYPWTEVCVSVTSHHRSGLLDPQTAASSFNFPFSGREVSTFIGAGAPATCIQTKPYLQTRACIQLREKRNALCGYYLVAKG